jgi:predicted Ser/Thr protein kinase
MESGVNVGPSPAVPSAAELADRFPGYEIQECLGHGGMGVVYKARQKSLDRMVAIKILLPDRMGMGTFAGRFAREAATLAKLSHPNIVTVHDFGEAEGLFYLVMEYVDGLNLRELLVDGPLRPKQALAIIPPVCEALQYAHEKGFVHRDIKPENLLVDAAGRVKIADFGVAELLGAKADGAGTPAYMAPEQGGNHAGADHRADVYALGVVLYEMLTGERPSGNPIAPSRKVQVDVRLDEIVLKALEKDPERRYQQAVLFGARTEAYAAGMNQSGKRRVSRTMMVACAWMTVGAVALYQFFFSGRYQPGWAAFMNFNGYPTGPVGVLGAFLSTLLGWIAVWQIRHSSGRLRGIPLAYVAAFFFPVVVPLTYGFWWLKGAEFAAVPPSVSEEAARDFLNLKIEEAGLLASGYGDQHPRLHVLREELAILQKQVPGLPDHECRMMAKMRLFKMQRQLEMLKVNGMGESHPVYKKAQAELAVVKEIFSGH